jgi:hypothetical protein
VEKTRSQAIRAALRAAYAALPEGAAVLEAYIDELEKQVVALSADDPYRALVLDLHTTMVRVDSGLLADVARIEAGRLEVRKAELARDAALAADRQDARGVWKAVLSPKVLVVLLPLLFGSTGLGGLIAHYVFADSTAPPAQVEKAKEASQP